MKHMRRLAGWILPLLALGMAWAAPGDAGISVSIYPDTTWVEPDSLFTAYVWIDTAGTDFDGYETVIDFDDSMIEFVSVQQETLMTEACPQAPWWYPVPGPDSVFISHVILCGGLTITGPGALSSITFRALQEGETWITFRYIEFYRAGILLPDVVSHDGVVFIGPISGVGDPQGGLQPRLGFEVCPNPAQGPVRLALELPRDARVELELVDAGGRRVADLRRQTWLPAGRHGLSLDLGSSGRPLERGIYFLRMRAGPLSATCKIALSP